MEIIIKYLPDIIRGTISASLIFLFIFSMGRPKKKYSIPVSVGISFFVTVITEISLYPKNSYNLIGIAVIVVYAPILLLLKIFYKDTLMQWIFNIATGLIVFCVVVFISYWSSRLFINQNFWNVLFRIIYLSIFLILFLVFLRKIYHELSLKWQYLFIPSVAILGLFIYAYIFMGNLKDSLSNYWILYVIIIFLTIAVYISLISFMKAMQNEKLLKEKAHNNERQKDLLEFELGVEREYVEIAKSYKHDIRHHANIVLELLNQNKIAEAKKYLKEYDSNIVDSTYVQYCDNNIVNAIFRLISRQCNSVGIKYNFNIMIPNKLPITYIEIGILFGNLLENAYEACLKCDNAFIDVVANIKNNNLFVEVKNSVKGEVKFVEDMPVTTKNINGGIGTTNMKKLLQKFNGMINFKQENMIFITQIYLPLIKNNVD